MEKDIIVPFSNATTVRSAQEMDVGAPIGDDRIEFSIPSAAPDFRKQFSDDVYDFYDNQNIESPKTADPNSNPQNYRHEPRSTKMKTSKSNNNNNKETTKSTNLKAENRQSENKGEAKSASPGPDVSMVVDLLDDMTETNMEIVYNSNTNNDNNNNIKDQKTIGNTNNVNTNNNNNNNNGKGDGWMKSRSNSVSSKLNSQIWLNDVLKIEELMLNEEKNYNNRILDECSSFVPKSNIVDNLDSKFEMLQELGRGATSRVVLAKNLATNELVALKQLKKSDKFNLRSFKDEFHILSQLSHKNIIELKDCYIDNYNFYIETKYYKGGNLVDCIKNFFYFCEEQATRYLYTIISIINYCHSKNIIHRDLKPGNLVFDREPNTDFNKITASTKSGATNLTGYTSQDGINGADSAQLKLIDFGLAIEISDNETNNEYVGTLIYMPPESCGERKGWQLKYGDMWSIGIIAYILVVGKAPFNGTTNVSLMKSIISDKLTFPDDIELTDECIDFITKLLNKDCKKRMTAKEALAHPWLATAGGLYSTLRSIDGTTLQLLDSTPQRSVTMQRNLGDKYKANIQSFLSNESSLRLADKDIPASKMGEKEKSILEGDNEIEESAICDYLIDLKMDKKAATLRAKAVFDTMNNAQHGHMEPQLFAKMSKGSHGTSKSENEKAEHEAAQDDALPKTTTTNSSNDKNNHNNNNNNNKKKTDDDDDDDEGNSKSTNQKACCCIM